MCRIQSVTRWLVLVCAAMHTSSADNRPQRVWIRFLSNRAPYAAELDGLLSRDEVSGHDFVYGELRIGDKGGRKQLLAEYEQMHQAPVVAHDDVVAFVRERRLHGRGVGWIDAHLRASALVGRLRLWTADPRLARRAKELGIAYE